MDSVQLLAHVRPYLLHVDPSGMIRAAAGGYLGVLDCKSEELVGHSVLDYVHADDHDTIASYFVDSTESADVALPVPFRAAMVGGDGRAIPVEVIATSLNGGPCEGWVITVVPHELMSIPVHPFEALIHNRPLPEILALIADTATMEVHGGHRACGYVIANKYNGILSSVYGGTSHPQLRFELEEALSTSEAKMWDHEPADFDAVSLDRLPAAVKAAAEAKGFRSARIARIAIDDTSEGVLIAFTAAPQGRLYENIRRNLRQSADIAAIAIEQHRTRRALEAAAHFDPLTGAANRDHFWKIAAGRAPNICVLYVDIDRFKSVNDEYGHNAGDDVLREIARRLQASCRPNDIVARVGGDEFVILLEHTTIDGASTVARRVIAEAARPLRSTTGPEQVTVSVGVAVGHCEVAEALNRADQAMLAAKRAGRGRVEVAD